MTVETRAAGTITNQTGIGSEAWTSPSNAGADDNVFTQVVVPMAASAVGTNYLRATNFGFAIPSGSTINSVVAKVRRRCPETDGLDDYVVDTDVREYAAGIVGSDLSNGSFWSATEEEISYGLSVTNTWSGINSSTFGIALAASITINTHTTDVTAQIDYISMTVDYDPPVIPPPPRPGLGGLNTGGAFFLGMIAQQAVLLIALGCVFAGLGVEPDRHPHAADFTAVVVSADAGHVLAALPAGDRFSGPVHRLPDGGVIPRGDLREVLPAAVALDAAADDQRKADHGGPKRDS